MCGFLVSTLAVTPKFSEVFERSFQKIQYRGPDAQKILTLPNGMMGFHRLSIMDTSEAGVQPFTDASKRMSVVCNGEIYNFQELKQTFSASYPFQSNSDCEVLLPLYLEYGIEGMLTQIDGEFSFVIYDYQRDEFLAARDPMGIRPLFYGYDQQGVIHFASEAKALTDFCQKITPFPPGHYYLNGEFKSYLELAQAIRHEHQLPEVLDNIHDLFYSAVKKRLTADVPMGFLLSGGLDSSLVCAIAARESKTPITTFSVGIQDDPIDTHYARIVAKHIGSIHHEVLFTKEEMLEALEEIVYKLETYDITTIRASVGMYLLCKYVKEKTDIKVILTGECSDELFGYKYTDFAPNADEFQREAEKRVRELYMYDVLRADRCISSNSLEARVPFSDTKFVQYVMGIDPEIKMNRYNMGKYLLRKAFDHDDYLPSKILYRDKAAFSDAVGHSAVDTLKLVSEKMFTTEQFLALKSSYEHAVPFTKESLWYRQIFDKHFHSHSQMVKNFWMPNKQWENCNVDDPSARVLPNYGASAKVPKTQKTA